MQQYDLSLAPVESMLRPETPSESESPHVNDPLNARGVRLGWAIKLVYAVRQEIANMWERYNHHLKAYEQLNWNDSIPEPTRPEIPESQEVTPLFLVDHVIRPLTRQSRAALYHRIPTDAVAAPKAFVSHSWAQPLEETLAFGLDSDKSPDSNKSDVPIWLDVLVYNQHEPQSVAGDMEMIVGSIGSLVSLFKPDRELRRLWCLWEVLCAHSSGATIAVIEPALSSHYFGKARSDFERSFTSVLAAETTLAADREQILAAIIRAFGSIEAADEFIRQTALKDLTSESDAPYNRRKNPPESRKPG